MLVHLSSLIYLVFLANKGFFFFFTRYCNCSLPLRNWMTLFKCLFDSSYIIAAFNSVAFLEQSVRSMPSGNYLTQSCQKKMEKMP